MRIMAAVNPPVFRSPKEAVVIEARILITDCILEQPEQLVPLLEACVAAGERRLFIIAPEVREAVVGLLAVNVQRGVLEAVGARPFDRLRLGMHPGDLMILPENNTNVIYPLRGIPMTVLRVIELPSARGLTTVQPWIGAGFYSELLGPLPFAFGTVPPERSG